MNILFFLPNSLLYGGGEENWLIEVGNRLAQKGHNIIIITLSYTPIVRACSVKLTKGIRHEECPYLKLPRGCALPSLFTMAKMVKLANEVDVVYIFAVHPPNELLLRILKPSIKRPIIIGIHSVPYRFVMTERVYITLLKHLLDFSTAFHVPIRYTEFILKRWGYENVYRIPNGVDISEFRLCDDPANSSTFNILFTGRIEHSKGVDILIKLIHIINKEKNMRDANFLICGSGSLDHIVRRVADQYDNVKFLGFIPRKELISVYRKSHLFLVPSREEQMPLRLLEAQACGLPAVASKIFGISDVISTCKSGEMIAINNIYGFIESIKRYCEMWHQHPDRYYEMCKRIRSCIIKNYSWSSVIKRLENMLKNIAG